MDSLGHLRQLVALAETGNFRKAGQRLGISHSAVSQTIKRIEAEYGAELFDRMRFDGARNETVPTALGERMVAAARIAISEMEAAARDVATATTVLLNPAAAANTDTAEVAASVDTSAAAPSPRTTSDALADRT